MTRRRQPLCVLLLIVLLTSMLYVGAPVGSEPHEEQSVSIDDQTIDSTNEASDSEPTKEINLESVDSRPEPFYPSSANNGPRPNWEETPRTNSPPIFDNHHIIEAQNLGSPAYTGSGVRVSVIDEGVDIGHPDLYGSHFVQPTGQGPAPYQGWPVAFDPMSMGIWLRDKKYEETWYANTTQVGTDTFEVMHYILVDGRIDFGESERLVDDPLGDSSVAPDGNKMDFDLRELYVTHDEKFWYFGFPTYLLYDNVTYGLLIDVDNETSGTTSVPEGKLVNTNTTHHGNPPNDLGINDVAVSPDGTMLATIAGDKHVKVWWINGTRRYDLIGHTSKPFSLEWSPDSRYLASRDKDRIIIWDMDSNGAIYRNLAFNLFQPPIVTLDIDPMNMLVYSSSLAFAPNGTWVAASSGQRIYFFDIPTGTAAAHMTAASSGTIRSIALNPNSTYPPQIAVGVDGYSRPPMPAGLHGVRIFNLNSSTLSNPSVASPPIALSAWNGSSSITDPLRHTAGILGLAWSPDGSRIVSTAMDNFMMLWEPLSDTNPKNSASSNSSWVYAAAWQRGGSPQPLFATASKYLIGTGDPKASLRLWDYDGNPAGYFMVNRTTYAVDWTNSDEIVTASIDLSARLWNQAGTLQRIYIQNKPDFAVMIEAGLNYSLKDLKWQKTVYNGTFYTWNGADWGVGYEVTKTPINGTQVSFGVDEVFVELGVPVSILGNPKGISVEMFSASPQNITNASWPGAIPNSHAQDTVPIDGVFDLDGDGKVDRGGLTPPVDWSEVETPLGGFQYIPVTYYHVDTMQINSTGGQFHFGYHPSQQLAQKYGSLGILVWDSKFAGDFDTVVIDMNNDKKFDNNDPKLTKSNPVVFGDYFTPFIGDPDTSSGLMYFISDGVNGLPYSDRFMAINGIQESNIPGNGDLVAFAGEFGLDPDTAEGLEHGTWMASIIASRGNVNPTEMTGIAPDSKLIPVVNALEDVITSWYFAVEGYDGIPGSGDEAQIVLNPFTYPRTKDDGFDMYSRTADYLSNSRSAGKTVFIGPAGEEGFGYATVASPSASPGIITVGRTYDGTLDSLISGEGPNIHYNSIASKSSRGPSASGFPEPDLVAIGNTAVNKPLLRSYQPDIFGAIGSEFSAAIVAGVSALLIEAAERGGKNITAEMIKNYLMSGADNLGYDILVQGAGFLNASRSMKLLLGNVLGAGTLVSPSTWVPGTYKGTKPEAFTKFLLPGEGDQQTFIIENRDSQSLLISYDATILERWGGYNFTNKTIRTFDNEMFIWVNRSGIFVPDEFTGVPVNLSGPINQNIWDNAEMLKLTAYSKYDDLIVSSGIDTYTNLYCYDLVLMDWGWTPGSMYGYPTVGAPWELNTIDKLEQTSNVMEGRVARPGKEITDSLIFKLEKPNTDECKRPNLTWNFSLDFYRGVPWNWMTFNPTFIPPLMSGTSASFTATVTIPANTPMGSYEGAIYVNDSTNTHELTIPILVNIATNSPNFVFGGNIPQQVDLFDANRVYSGRDLTLIGTNVRYPYLGDWRFFYVFLPDEGLNIAGASIKMVIQLNWTVKPSDLDLLALTPAPAADTASQFDSGRFGPKSVREVAASESEAKPIFKTLSNTSQDYISFQLVGGLNVIGVHQMLLNGDKPYEMFSGSGMWWRVPREMRKATQNLAGSMSGNAMLSADLFGGFRVSAVGPAITSENNSEIIKQDWQDWMRSLPFQLALAKGSYTYCIELKKVLILNVKISSLEAPDLDLGVFRDLSDDCKLDEASEATGPFCQGLNCVGSVQWALSAGPTADEEIRWLQPPDGRYIIKVLGFDVPGGVGHFDMKVEQTLDTGTGYYVPEAPKPEEILVGTKPVLNSFTIVNFSMVWDFPGDQEDGNYSGAVQLGTATASGIVLVPAVVILDRVEPTIKSFSVQSNLMLVNNTDPTLTNDPIPILIVEFKDPLMGTLDKGTMRMVVDGVDVSPLTRVNLILETSPFVLPGVTGPWGYWKGDISYTSIRPYSHGVHTLYVAIGDEARNFIHQNYTFTVDLLSPGLTLIGSAIEYTDLDTYFIQGQTDSNAYLKVAGTWSQADSSGQFSIPVGLQPGRNIIQVTAANWFSTIKNVTKVANPVSIDKTIIYDTIAPTLVGTTLTPSGYYVNVDSVELYGQLEDLMANNTPLDASLLNLTVNGNVVQVMPDGTFSTIVPLQEGINTIQIRAVDRAGNEFNATPIEVVSDMTVPTIQVVDLPERTESATVTVKVSTEAGATVMVNGYSTTFSGGYHTRDVTLSPGRNAIVIRAEDAAHNIAESTVYVEYGATSPFFGPAGGAAAIAVMILIVIVVALIVVFLLMRFKGRGEEPEEEGIEPEPIAEEKEEVEGIEEEVMEEELPTEEELPPEEKPMEEKPPEELKPPEATPAEPPGPTPTLVKFRVSRSRTALDAGRITKETYEQNLKSMGLTEEDADRILEDIRLEEGGKEAPAPPPPQVEAVPEAKKGPTKEDKVKMLRKALNEGRISQDVFEQNLHSMGLTEEDVEKILGETKAEEVGKEAQPPAPEVKKGPTKEDKIKALRKALEDGRISQEVFEENLRRLEQS